MYCKWHGCVHRVAGPSGNWQHDPNSWFQHNVAKFYLEGIITRSTFMSLCMYYIHMTCVLAYRTVSPILSLVGITSSSNPTNCCLKRHNGVTDSAALLCADVVDNISSTTCAAMHSSGVLKVKFPFFPMLCCGEGKGRDVRWNKRCLAKEECNFIVSQSMAEFREVCLAVKKQRDKYFFLTLWVKSTQYCRNF